MVDVIIESGMGFVPDNAFHIEKSALYKNIGEGIRSVEFIRVKDESLLFVEARKTFPNPNNASAENLIKLQLEITEICEKYLHSLNLFSAMKVGVTDYEFHKDFILPQKITLVFVLVIKNHKPEWCRNIKSAIEAALPLYLKKIWKPKVFVINEITAVSRGLIVN